MPKIPQEIKPKGPVRTSDVARRLSGTRTLILLLLGAAVCMAGLALRNQTIGLDEPLLDGRALGYTAAEAHRVLGRLSEDHRHLYAITGLTLDTIFPMLYVSLLLGLTVRLFPASGGALALPIVAGISDLAENVAVAWLGLAYPDELPSLATIAGALTLTKWWTISTVGVIVAWGAFRRITRSNAPDDHKWVAKIGDVLEKELEYVRQRRRHSLTAKENPRDTLIGVALSGGGIRSATTCLGMLQALSRHRILPLVDYLSTVSGGGYIGACLTSLLTLPHPNSNRPIFSTEWDSFPLNPEHREGRTQVDHLRTHGSFLVTRTGLLARETMRSIGYLLSGTLYHLAVALLALAIVALFYLAGVLALSPPLHRTLIQDAGYRYVLRDPAYEASRPATSERNVYRYPTVVERLHHKYTLMQGAARTAAGTPFARQATLAFVGFGVALSCVTFAYLLLSHKLKGRPQLGESERDARERALLKHAGVGGVYAMALFFAVAWVNRGGYAEVLWLFLPALALLTALLTSFVMHLFLPRLGPLKAWNRSMRSLWGAFQAMTWYAFLIALLRPCCLSPPMPFAMRGAAREPPGRSRW